LVGTSTNLLVNGMAKDLGHPGFSMFEFTPLGVICMAAGCLYLLTVGRWLLPDTSATQMVENHELGKYVTELRVMPDSSLIGASVEDAKLGETFDVYVLELLRDDEEVWSPRSQVLQEGDVLLARGDWSKLDELRQEAGLELNPEFRRRLRRMAAPGDDDSESVSQVLTEVMIAPRSRLVGSTLTTLDWRWRHDAIVLAIHRRGQVLREKLKDVRLNVGDVLLMLTTEPEMNTLRQDNNLIVLSEREAQPQRGWRAPFALATMATVIAVSALGWLPISIMALVGAVAMTLAGCLAADGVYDAIDWPIIILLAGLLPLGVAMRDSGAAELIVQTTIGLVREAGPQGALSGLYLMALLLTVCLGDVAAAVMY